MEKDLKTIANEVIDLFAKEGLTIQEARKVMSIVSLATLDNALIQPTRSK